MKIRQHIVSIKVDHRERDVFEITMTDREGNQAIGFTTVRGLVRLAKRIQEVQEQYLAITGAQ